MNAFFSSLSLDHGPRGTEFFLSLHVFESSERWGEHRENPVPDPERTKTTDASRSRSLASALHFVLALARNRPYVRAVIEDKRTRETTS